MIAQVVCPRLSSCLISSICECDENALLVYI
uniref:Uncharacterized protein n=1 Tax=Setaria italica TaxID=4555 RepID=K4ANC7_SETIT